MTSVVEVRPQEIISLVEKGPSIDNGKPSELVYPLCIVYGEQGVSIRSAEGQQQAVHRSQNDGRWHPGHIEFEPWIFRA
jgi:hypothetical protein